MANFTKARSGVYVGDGYVITRNQHGSWVIRRGGDRLTHTHTLKDAIEWAESHKPTTL